IADVLVDGELRPAADVDVLDDALVLLREELGERLRRLVQVVVGVEHREVERTRLLEHQLDALDLRRLHRVGDDPSSMTWHRSLLPVVGPLFEGRRSATFASTGTRQFSAGTWEL